MKNYKIFIIVTICIVLLGISGTLAYFIWSSTSENKDTTVDVTISGGKGVCEKITDNDKLLIPVASRDEGRVITIKANQELAESAVITWNMTINSINTEDTTTNGLKHESFKYELVNTTTNTSYGSGDFSEITEGSTIVFSADEKILINTDYVFTLYLWIDGFWGTNPSDMTNQPYNFSLVCNITGADAGTSS